LRGDDGVGSGPEAEHDWRSWFERERARAEAAEAPTEELHWAEVRSRSDARVWQSRFESSRRRLKAAVEETKEVRRRAKEALSLEPEVARLRRLLSEARKKPQAPKTTPGSRSREAGRLRKTLETAQAQKDRIRSLRTEVAGLRQGTREAEARKGEVRSLSRLTEHLRARPRDFQEQRDRVRVLSWQIDILRLDLDGVHASLKRAEDEKKALEDELAKVRASRSAAGASGRSGRAPGGGAATSPALPAMDAPGGPRSRSGPRSTTRRRTRASVAVAGRTTWPTAPMSPRWWRSM
jgi:chromosome segregation ATPase